MSAVAWVNLGGALLVVLIVWWFWLTKRR